MTSFTNVFFSSLLLFGAGMAQATVWQTARYEDRGVAGRKLIERGTFEDDRDAAPGIVSERSMPQFVAEHEPVGPDKIVTLTAADVATLDAELARRKVAMTLPEALEDGLDELVTLVNSGPSANRIDVVFMGDGYTAAERDKFFMDIQRMVNDMFQGETFSSYLPLFNVHAVFRPSVESGIGRNDTPRNTAYKLYREGATLRAIYPGNTSAIRSSCATAPGCDYPVVIANDPHYGGLGGEVAISTSSVTSGTVVLRHELGHNFGQVGEEYDGGGYFGANVSSSVSSLKWRHWASQEVTTAEPTAARFLAWPWHQLSSGPYSINFTSDGNYANSSIRFSASGMAVDNTISITLDGEPLPFQSPNDNDRHFIDLDFDHGFTAGRHTLRFQENVADGDNWVSNLTVHEYGPGYHFDPDFIGAYPLFASAGSVASYRSTHESCLMRNMLSTHFCPICQENNWHEFFGKVKLIDDISSTRDTEGVSVRLTTQQLGQLRTQGAVRADGEMLTVKWFRDGTEVPSLADRFDWQLPTRDATGRWEAEVRLITPEVRADPRNLLKDRRSITL